MCLGQLEEMLSMTMPQESNSALIPSKWSVLFNVLYSTIFKVGIPTIYSLMNIAL